MNLAHIRGMGKYLTNVLSHVPANEAVSWKLFGNRPDVPLEANVTGPVQYHRFALRGSRFDAWVQLGLPMAAARRRVDVLHFASTTISLWQPVPAVVTIHDTIPWGHQETPEWPTWYQDWLLPLAYRRCAAVITISESSRRDILRLWPDLESKLHVIPNGVADSYLSRSAARLSESLNRYGVREPYFLFVGGDAPRKRLDWAVQVVDRLGAPEAQLVVCGVAASKHDAVRKRIPESLRPSVVFMPFISEDEMMQLYQNAVGVLYPTLYEGFGLPVVEAQAVGTPILFSPLSSLEELQGPGTVVLPVNELDAWVAACRTLLASRSENPAPLEGARVWARRFAWSVSAERHCQVYRQAAASRPSMADQHLENLKLKPSCSGANGDAAAARPRHASVERRKSVERA